MAQGQQQHQQKLQSLFTAGGNCLQQQPISWCAVVVAVLHNSIDRSGKWGDEGEGREKTTGEEGKPLEGRRSVLACKLAVIYGSRRLFTLCRHQKNDGHRPDGTHTSTNSKGEKEREGNSTLSGQFHFWEGEVKFRRFRISAKTKSTVFLKCTCTEFNCVDIGTLTSQSVLLMSFRLSLNTLSLGLREGREKEKVVVIVNQKTKKLKTAAKKSTVKHHHWQHVRQFFLFSSAAKTKTAEPSWTLRESKKQSDKFLRQLDNCHTWGGEEGGKQNSDLQTSYGQLKKEERKPQPKKLLLHPRRIVCTTAHRVMQMCRFLLAVHCSLLLKLVTGLRFP